ncbi:WecB/TagA/CpsF family glycosyltransferase [Aureimonas fodinaquatilis]|uniref:WecB/TagA/CpsF family glycosyltransferase n=1 Tax=Aureimonas fodinaquatilis TaxID=2565783 RepID=UPI00165DED36|nr:WecB/TagA/CpsF family glycosyltransferase [Aureimonas fodinaquatilis]
MSTCRILGVAIANETMEAAQNYIAAQIQEGGASSIYFVNAHTLNFASSDPAYRTVLSRAHRIYGDGTGVRWAARFRGVNLLDNVNGTDLIPLILASGKNLRCFLVGSTPARIETISNRVSELFPNTQVVGAHHGYLDDTMSQTVVDAINASGANLVLVGMGNPLQERWIDQYGSSVPGALMIGVGGLFEYWSGALDRAPLWMRRMGIEWVHLMLRQPWKARRYLIGNPIYIFRAIRYARADRKAFFELEENVQCRDKVLHQVDGLPKKLPEWSSAEGEASLDGFFDHQNPRSAS